MTPFQRLVTRNSWLQRHCLISIGFGLLSATALVLWLMTVFLLTDLLIVRGAEAERIVLDAVAREQAPLGLLPDPGLWVQAIRFGNSPGWSWLPSICDRVTLLRTTRGSLTLLVIIGLLLSGTFTWARTRSRVFSARAAQETATRLRNSIHRQTLRLGPSDLTGQNHEHALKLFCDDTEAIRESLAEWRFRYIRGIIILPVLTLSLLAMDWRLGLQCAIPTVACWWISRYERRSGAARRQMSEAHAETEVQFLSDSLRQTRLVRGYNMEEFERTLFQNHLHRMTEDLRTGRRLEQAALTTARFVIWAGIALIALLIAVRVTTPINPFPLSGAIVLGLILAALIIELNSWDRLELLKSAVNHSGEQIQAYLDEIPQVGQAVGAKFIEPVSKSIILEAVRYQHCGTPILSGVDLRIPAGTQTALVGLDPLAPRAVAYLIARFIEPTKGRVLFDGEDIAWGTLESIHSEVLYVGSDDPMLPGTVLDNILCGDKRYSLPDAIEAAKEVHAHKFVSQLPQGYQTLLDENGHQLSVGEQFRLGLTRAALRRPAVIIIEEPRVILDENTRALIDDAYQRLSGRSTLIFLPSRLSTLRRCDQVVMLHDGSVAAIGTHQELARKSEIYRHWDYVTFNSFSRQSRTMAEIT